MKVKSKFKKILTSILIISTPAILATPIFFSKNIESEVVTLSNDSKAVNNNVISVIQNIDLNSNLGAPIAVIYDKVDFPNTTNIQFNKQYLLSIVGKTFKKVSKPAEEETDPTKELDYQIWSTLSSFVKGIRTPNSKWTGVSLDNAEFRVDRLTTTMNGSIFFAVEIKINNVYENDKQIIPTLENGLIENAIIELSGFKKFVKGDAEWNNFTITSDDPIKLDYFELANLSFSIENQIKQIEQLIKNNWIYFFNFKNDGVISSATPDGNALDLFKNSIQISGPVAFKENKILFTFVYVSKCSGDLNTQEVAKVGCEIFNVELNSSNSGMGMSKIIGIALSIGGGTILLVAMIILLIKKSKTDDDEDDELEFNKVEYIPDEFTGYVEYDDENQNYLESSNENAGYLGDENQNYDMDASEYSSESEQEKNHENDDELLGSTENLNIKYDDYVEDGEVSSEFDNEKNN